jgi:hypothetical protein
MKFLQALLEGQLSQYPSQNDVNLSTLVDLNLQDRLYMLYSFLVENDGDVVSKNLFHLLEFKDELEFLKLANKRGTEPNLIKLEYQKLLNKLDKLPFGDPTQFYQLYY